MVSKRRAVELRGLQVHWLWPIIAVGLGTGFACCKTRLGLAAEVVPSLITAHYGVP